MTPEGRAEFERFSADRDPTLKCIMPGVPLGIHDPYPLEIVQQDHQIVFLHEHFHMVRRIFMDGREAPENWWPSLVGFSVGSWEGDTLVVKTTHMSPENLMWHNGMPFRATRKRTSSNATTSTAMNFLSRPKCTTPVTMRSRMSSAAPGRWRRTE